MKLLPGTKPRDRRTLSVIPAFDNKLPMWTRDGRFEARFDSPRREGGFVARLVGFKGTWGEDRKLAYRDDGRLFRIGKPVDHHPLDLVNR